MCEVDLSVCIPTGCLKNIPMKSVYSYVRFLCQSLSHTANLHLTESTERTENENKSRLFSVKEAEVRICSERKYNINTSLICVR